MLWSRVSQAALAQHAQCRDQSGVSVSCTSILADLTSPLPLRCLFTVSLYSYTFTFSLPYPHLRPHLTHQNPQIGFAELPVRTFSYYQCIPPPAEEFGWPSLDRSTKGVLGAPRATHMQAAARHAEAARMRDQHCCFAISTTRGAVHLRDRIRP